MLELRRPAAVSTLRPCLTCGHPTRDSRCTLHRLPSRGRADRRLRAQVLAEETLCWRCGHPGTHADPLVMGHVVARARGGPLTRANVHAEHASCNLKAGATR